jgi:SAM-dependent methyltransferase
MHRKNLHDTWIDAGPICGAPEGEYSKPPRYFPYYESELAPLRDKALTIVEIGVFRGQFLETLGQFFPNARVIGIDFQPERATFRSPNITLVRGDQGDPTGLDAIFREHAPNGADIVIDDASHVGQLTQSAYQVAIQHVKPGARYYIEDWCTGYWPDWPDGSKIEPPAFEGKSAAGFAARYRSHSAGMIGVIKELIDHVGAPEQLGVIPLSSMSLNDGVVKLVRK